MVHKSIILSESINHLFFINFTNKFIFSTPDCMKNIDTSYYHSLTCRIIDFITIISKNY